MRRPGPVSTALRKRAPFPSEAKNAEEAAWLAHRNYAVVVDAGSSGSRLMVYSWRDAAWEKRLRKAQNLSLDTLPTIEKGTWDGSQRPWQFKVEPGLSSFAGHVHDVKPYLVELFSHVQSIVPPEAWSRTPVHVLATAGMRMVPDDQRKAILQEACAVLHELPFAVRNQDTPAADSYCGGQVRVISGEEEGLFGWITVNYLMDGFSTSNTSAPPSELASALGKTTYGFLDMGGASTQIAFEPSLDALTAPADTTGESSSKQEKDLFDVLFRRLDGSIVQHHVFVTTFLGFGTNAARTRYLEELRAASSDPAAPLLDPCMPKNLRILSEPDHRPVHGTGSFADCLAKQEPLLDRDALCGQPPCLFHGVHVPAIDFSSNQFIGVSEYWYSSNDVFDLGGTYDYTSYQKAAQEFCGEEWSTLASNLAQNQYKEQVSLSRLQMQCFKAAWMVTVLHEGLQLPRLGDTNAAEDAPDYAQEIPEKATSKNLFQSVNDVRGLGVSWTLGKVVLEASTDIPPASTPLLPARWGTEVPFFRPFVGLICFAALGALVYRWMRRRRRLEEWTAIPISELEASGRHTVVPMGPLADGAYRDAAPKPYSPRSRASSPSRKARKGRLLSIVAGTSPAPAALPRSNPSSPFLTAPTSRIASPRPGIARSDSMPTLRSPRISAAVASGMMYNSGPPSRGPSPMFLDARRPTMAMTSVPSVPDRGSGAERPIHSTQ